MKALHSTTKNYSFKRCYTNKKQKYQLDDFLLEPIFITDKDFKRLEEDTEPTENLIKLLNEY